jgi:hypothetical protein
MAQQDRNWSARATRDSKALDLGRACSPGMPRVFGQATEPQALSQACS